MLNTSELGVAEAASYQICLVGLLDARWAATMDGVSVFSEEVDGGCIVTTLGGRVADQAALLGILNLAYSLGLSLLSVKYLPDEKNKLA